MAVRQALVDTSPLRSSSAFRRLWLGQAFSGIGSQMTLVALMFQVWQLTGSTVWTGAVGLAQAMPLVMLGLFAGSIVDRTDRRRIYLITTTGQAACSVLLAVQALSGRLPVPAILTLVAVQAGFGACGGPAARTFIPRLLPADQLAAGLALNRITFQASVLLGPALGGLVQLQTHDAMRGRVAAAEQIVGQAGPDVGNMRAGLIADATSSMLALVSGGLLCLAAVALIAAVTPRLRATTIRTPQAAT